MFYKKIIYKNKLLHIGKYFYTHKGGIETAIKEIINTNNIKKYNQTLISFSDKNETYKINNTNFFNFKVLFTLFSQPFSFCYFFRVIMELNKHNVIIFHYPNFLVLIFSLFVKSDNKLYVYWHADIINYHGLSFFISQLEKLMLTKATKIIIGTKIYAKESKILNGFQSKLEFIRYGINSLHQVENYKETLFFKKELAKLSKKKILLSVGRLVKYKGFDQLIKVMDYVNDNIFLYIVGNGHEYSNLISLIKKNKKKNIKILRNLSDYNLEVLYKSSFLYISCSQGRQESFGISLLEAQKFSLPIITTNTETTGMFEININGKTGYNLRTRDKLRVSNKINYLSKNKSLMQKFKKASNYNFNSFYKSEVMQKKLNHLISNK